MASRRLDGDPRPREQIPSGVPAIGLMTVDHFQPGSKRYSPNTTSSEGPQGVQTA